MINGELISSQIKVLLIEDNPDDAHIVKKLLSKSVGFFSVVDVADHLSSGAKGLSGGIYDILLLDLELPDSNRMATIRKKLGFSNRSINLTSYLRKV